MIDNEILEKLSEISDGQWKRIIKKCFGHIDIKLYRKTISGAHCEQRLGEPAHDYYFMKAYESIYNGIWKWNYEKFTIEQQFIRIIDSMISEQVRKYEIEVKHNRKIVLIETEQLNIFDSPKHTEDELDDAYINKLSTALKMTCQNNELYTRFIELKREGLSYDDICIKMNCHIKQTYRIRDAIAKKAKKILKSL